MSSPRPLRPEILEELRGAAERGEVYTPQQWLTIFGLNNVYRYSSVRYVRMMCRGQVIRSGGREYKLSLPAGWLAKQIGRDWYIYRPAAKAGGPAPGGADGLSASPAAAG